MTRKTVKKIVRGITDKIEATTDIDDWAEFWGFTRDEYEEFLDMPIKALEHEPTKNDLGVDAISRQAVLDLINADWKYDNLEIEINNLPSVTPIRPKGHWICDGKGRSFADYHCSKCGLKLALCGQDIKQRQDSGYSLFCGGCGADMREVEE